MFPGVISAVVLTAIMSAIMSTVAALLLLVGTLVSIDFYKRWLRPNASDKSVVLVSRMSILAVGVVGITIAILNPPGVFGLVIFSFGTMSAAFLPSYICAVWWKKANAMGSCASMVLGGGTAFFWTLLDMEEKTDVHAFLAGVVVSIIAMLIFSNFGKPTSPEMMTLMEKSAGKKANVSPKIQAATSTQMSAENNAVSKFMTQNNYLKEKGFQLTC